MDDLAAHIAQEEASVRKDNKAVDTEPHEEGNDHVSVIELALRHLADMEVKVWKVSDTRIADAYIVGDGSHWQALVKICGKWQLLDQKTQYVSDLNNLLRLRSRQRMVLSCYLPETPNTMETDRSFKKRQFNDTESGCHLMITAGPAQDATEIVSPEGKKARSEDLSQASTAALIMHLHTPYIRLQEATQQSNMTLTPIVIAPTVQEPDEWKNVVVGSTGMLFNAAMNKYRCASPGCTFESGKAAGVAVHFARYCKVSQKEIDAIGVDSGEIENKSADVKPEI